MGLDGSCVLFAAVILCTKPGLPRRSFGRFPGWKLHPLRGDWKGSWSLTVTGNWRLIFHYDKPTNTASDIDLIDYH